MRRDESETIEDHLRRRRRTREVLGRPAGVGWLLAYWLFFAVVALAVLSYVSDAEGEPPDELAAAARRWQPLTRASDEVLGTLTRDSATSCSRMTRPLPDAERCPALLVALAFRESSWEPLARGRRGERGLMQLMPGAATVGTRLRELDDPTTNVFVAARWLDHAALRCSLSSPRNLAERSLSNYAGLGCASSRAARMVLRWANELHALAGGAS